MRGYIKNIISKLAHLSTKKRKIQRIKKSATYTPQAAQVKFPALPPRNNRRRKRNSVRRRKRESYKPQARKPRVQKTQPAATAPKMAKAQVDTIRPRLCAILPRLRTGRVADRRNCAGKRRPAGTVSTGSARRRPSRRRARSA